MRAFHSDEKIKEIYVARIKAHAAADEIIKGAYWLNGKGCAIGCTLHSNKHINYESELGIPLLLAHLEDGIFENLPNDLAMKWPLRFLEAINVGSDLSLVWSKFSHWLLIDPQYGVVRFNTDKSIIHIADLLLQQIQGNFVSSQQWQNAENAASAASDTAASNAAASAYTAYKTSSSAANAVYAAYAAYETASSAANAAYTAYRAVCNATSASANAAHYAAVADAAASEAAAAAASTAYVAHGFFKANYAVSDAATSAAAAATSAAAAATSAAAAAASAYYPFKEASKDHFIIMAEKLLDLLRQSK